MKLSNLNVSTKLWISVGLAFAGIALTIAISLMDVRSTLMAGKADQTRAVVESAHSIIAGYAKRADAGEMTVEAAQKSALKTLESARYLGSEYFWVNDMSAVVLMHPIKPTLNGKNLSKLEDRNGKKIFAEFVSTVRKNGAGYVDYLWPKPGHEDPVDKISYVKGFSPWGWVVGSGVYVDDVQSAFIGEAAKLGGIGFVMALFVVGFSVVSARSISHPLKALTTAIGELAHGDRTVDIPGVDRGDEIGSMAGAIDGFKAKLIEGDSLAKQSEAANAERVKRAERVEELAKRFEGEVQDALQTIAVAAQQMEGTATSLTEAAGSADVNSQAAAGAADEASANVQTVASAAEELSSSITEISRQVSQSTTIASQAVEDARATNTKVEGLSQAAQRIGEVVGLITDIAEQTNLLALNATIEAARAGDAGKGFAVVASEVKNLANQTASATDDISTQVSAIQTATKEAVDAIGGISRTIDEISEIASTIASAVEEQGAATQEIARNVAEAAIGTQTVTSSMASVRHSAGETENMAGQVLSASQELTQHEVTLRTRVRGFLDGLRAA